MKKLLFSALLGILALIIIMSFAGCNESKTEADTTAQELVTTVDDVTTAAEEVTTEAATEAVTEAITTVAEVTTVEEITTEEATTEEITTDNDPNDPAHNLIPVGTSADGKTVCYDGKYQFEEEYFQTPYEYFSSIQDAIDSLEGEGGNILIDTGTDLGVCLRVNVPDDGCRYRIAYNWSNVDFVFNYGITYDDDTESDYLDDEKTVHGYAYYSDINALDEIMGLDGTHIYIWSGVEGYAPGYYTMHYVGNNNAAGGMNYTYNRECNLEDKWPGLPLGETYNK